MRVLGLLAVILALLNSATAKLLNCDCTPGREGVRGHRGNYGLTGDMGAPGPRGMIGPRGRNGAVGDKGTVGPVGLSPWESPAGPAGPAGPPGAPGNCFDCVPRWRMGLRSWGNPGGFAGGFGTRGVAGPSAPFNGLTGLGANLNAIANPSVSQHSLNMNSVGQTPASALQPGNLIMLPPQFSQNFPQNFPQREQGPGNLSPNSMVVIHPNGQSVSLATLQSLLLNEGNLRPNAVTPPPPAPQPMQEAFPPIVSITGISSSQPFVLPESNPQSALAAIAPSAPSFPSPPPTSDFNDWQREMLLGEMSAQSPQSPALNVLVGMPDNPAVKQPFRAQATANVHTNQIADSLEEFQRALDEFRQRFAKLSASIEQRHGQQIAVVL